ncbi:hypothetical protein ACLOJK_026174 [Asimina triloba]
MILFGGRFVPSVRTLNLSRSITAFSIAAVEFKKGNNCSSLHLPALCIFEPYPPSTLSPRVPCLPGGESSESSVDEPSTSPPICYRFVVGSPPRPALRFSSVIGQVSLLSPSPLPSYALCHLASSPSLSPSNLSAPARTATSPLPSAGPAPSPSLSPSPLPSPSLPSRLLPFSLSLHPPCPRLHHLLSAALRRSRSLSLSLSLSPSLSSPFSLSVVPPPPLLSLPPPSLPPPAPPPLLCPPPVPLPLSLSLSSLFSLSVVPPPPLLSLPPPSLPPPAPPPLLCPPPVPLPLSLSLPLPSLLPLCRPASSSLSPSPLPAPAHTVYL